jgi:hypothetical protein
MKKDFQKFSLRQTLDEVSFNYVDDNYELEVAENGICTFNAYGKEEWIKFFPNGHAVYSHSGSVKDAIPFNSHQDAVDFIRV